MPLQKQFDTDEALKDAMNIFWDQGYAATSMQDLVDGMGINRGSLYATFGDKHALFILALRAYDNDNRRQLLSDLETKYPPGRAIRELFEAFAGAADDKPTAGCFLTNCALELAPHDPEVREIVANGQKEMEQFFVRMIEEGKALGEFAPDLDGPSAAVGLLAMIQGLLVVIRSRPEKALVKNIIDEALQRLE